MRKLKKIGKGVLILLAVLVLMLYFFQEKLIFLPSKLPQDYTYDFPQNFEEIFISHSDGAKLNALHFRQDNPKGVILYFHGNAGDLSRWGQMALPFVSLGYDVVMMDYRTYGKSTGKLSEAALQSDAQLFYDYTKKEYNNLPIVLFGRSLGTGIATHLASKNEAKQLILETPFYSLVDVAKERFPFLPVKMLLKYKFNSNLYISKIKYPVTIFHGTDDSVVPYDSGLKLFQSMDNSAKEMITIPDGEHNNLIEFEAYRKGVERLLR